MKLRSAHLVRALPSGEWIFKSFRFEGWRSFDRPEVGRKELEKGTKALKNWGRGRNLPIKRFCFLRGWPCRKAEVCTVWPKEC